MENEEVEEQYSKSNIDVGLDEYPEFAADSNAIDVDEGSDVAAKLDLAKVYVEMGDVDNAEVILEEIAISGDENQQKQAKELLQSLK